jgi:putative ABC transport system permease protein
MTMLGISRRTVRHAYRLYAGAFVALCLGVVLISTAVTLSGAVEATRRPGLPADQLDQLEGLSALFGVMAGISVFLAMFVVASTFAFMVAARRREVGLLRLIGATPRQVRRMVLGESLLVALVATAAGCGLSTLLAPVLVAALPALGLTSLQLRLPAPGLAWAVAGPCGIGVALLGSWRSSKRASRVPPLAALQEAAIEPRRPGPGQLVVGIVCSGITAAAVVVAGDFDPLGALLTAILLPEITVLGLACFGGLVFPWLAGRLAAPFVRGDVSARLARDQLGASGRTPASIAAPVLAISAIAGSLILTMALTGDWTTAMNRAQLAAPVVVETGGEAGVASRLASAPGLVVFDPRVTLRARVGPEGEHDAVEVVDVQAARRARGLRAVRGRLEDVGPHGVAVTTSYASDSGAGLGHRLRIRVAGNEQLRPVVVAIVPEAPDLYGDVLVARSLLSPAVRLDPPETVFVDPGGVQLIDLLAGTHAQVMTSDAWIGEVDRRTRATNELGLWVLLGPSGLYAGIAIVNAVLMGSTQRRRQLRTLALLGATSAQRRRAALWEAGLVGSAALLLGGAVTAYTGWLVRTAIVRDLPEAPLTLPWPALTAVLATGLGLTLVAAAAGARSEGRGSR